MFGLGALGYQLLTGHPWIDLGLDSDQALGRIVEREPVPFREHRVHGHAELEAVIMAALAKAPSARPQSVEQLTAWVRAAIARDADLTDAANGAAGRPVRRGAVDAVLEQVLPGGVLHRRGHAAPSASVSYGAAGVALALLRIASLRADPELLACADDWAERAQRLRGRPDAFVSPDLGPDRVTIGEGTPYHRVSGVALARALVAHAAGNTLARQAALAEYAAAAEHDDVLPDLTLGTAGALLGGALLVEAVRTDPYADPTAVREPGWTAGRPALDLARRCGDMASSTSITALGVAHGWAGLLLAVLRWVDAIGDRRARRPARSP